MSLRFRTPSFAALAAALALAPAASAIDVAGSYEGKLSCSPHRRQSAAASSASRSSEASRAAGEAPATSLRAISRSMPRRSR
jgi:hypothetical protein